jgi:integrase/recombinase XerD
MSTTMSESTVMAVAEPVFSNAERLALAGFFAGYSGLTREAYALDLRQHARWCQQRQLRLFEARAGRHRVLRPRPGSQGPGPGR